jgi:hypothetical protein
MNRKLLNGVGKMIKKAAILKGEVPLVYQDYVGKQNSRISENPLGGFEPLAKSIVAKVNEGQVSEELIDDQKVAYSKKADVTFIVVTDPNEVGVLEVFLPELIDLFFGVFPEDYIQSWDGEDTSVFTGFQSRMGQLRSSFSNKIMTKPGSRRILDETGLHELPQRIQQSARIILNEQTIPFHEILQRVDKKPEDIVKDIQGILNAGFLYTTKIGDKVYYSIKPFPKMTEGESVRTTESPSAKVTTTEETTTSVEPVTTATTPKEEIPGMTTKKRNMDKGNMPFLIKQVKNGLDKVFNAILNHHLLLLIIDPESDKQQVLLNMILDTLQCFAPERELRIITYTDSFIHPEEADIIRIKRSLTKFYSNETTLDMDNKKVNNGESSDYLASLIDQMRNMKHSECISLLLNRIALIKKIAQDWAKIQKLDLPSKDFLTNIRSKHSPAIVEVIRRVAENVYL